MWNKCLKILSESYHGIKTKGKTQEVIKFCEGKNGLKLSQ